MQRIQFEKFVGHKVIVYISDSNGCFEKYFAILVSVGEDSIQLVDSHYREYYFSFNVVTAIVEMSASQKEKFDILRGGLNNG